MELSKSDQCKSCGEPLVGPYCAQCGQSPYKGKLTIKRAFGDLVNAVTNVERGFTHTIIKMTTSPGLVIKEFLEGKTRPYFLPARYAFILVTISTLVLIKSGIFDLSQQVFNNPENMSENQRAMNAEIQNYVKQFLNFFVLIQLPFNAFISWLLFRKRGYNYAEHFVANTFMIGHLSLFGMAVIPLYYIIPNPETYGVINLFFSLSLSAFFYSLAYKQWFKDPWDESIARGVLTAILGIVLMMISLFVIGIIAVLFFILVRNVF